MGSAPSVPVLLGDIASLGITALIRLLSQKPEPDNETIRKLEEAMREKEAAERKQQEAKEAEERARREKKEAEENMRRAEEAARRAREEREAAERKAEGERAEALKRAREAEEKAEEQKRRAEAQKREAEKAREEAEEARKRAKQAETALQKGIRMVCSVSREEFEETKKKLGYRAEKLHFGICGTSGSGKSSLINAFRGISQWEPEVAGRDVAKVDIVECTSTITRYPDHRSQDPYSKFVWYDIPGAGTQAISDWQYFKDQGLYLFDFVILVYNDRFTDIDAAILRNCKIYGIPVFIVRSKSDQHVENMFKSRKRGARFNPARKEHVELYESLKQEYVKATRSNLSQELSRLVDSLRQNKSSGDLDLDISDAEIAEIANMKVYIVSAEVIRCFVGAAADGEDDDADDIVATNRIDEAMLVRDLLATAVERRGNDTAKVMGRMARLKV